ncbi:MAG: hypothetical protein WBV28_14080 [Terracidiphilus sp.]
MPQEQHAANQSWTASSTEPGNGSQRARDGDCRIALTSKICGSKSARPSAVGCHTVNAMRMGQRGKDSMPAGSTPERILQHQQTAEIREAKARGSKIREAATFAEDRHEILDACD